MTERLGRDEERRRRELLADLAHELRTPLSVIQGNAEGMLDGLYPMDRAHLDPVLEETKVMSRLLEDLQTLSTAEAGALRLHRERSSRGRSSRTRPRVYRSRADEAGVDLETARGERRGPIDVDPLRVGEVLLEPAVERAAPHAVRRDGDDFGRAGERRRRCSRSATPAPASRRSSSPTSSTGS